MSAHTVDHEMHVNSMRQFDKMLRSGKIGDRDAEVFRWMHAEQPKTDRQCKHGLHYHDMNYVRPSITRWHKRWIFKDYDHVRCEWEGTIVRRSIIAPIEEWDRPPPPPPAQADAFGYHDDEAILAELRREFRQRELVYPRFIEQNKLTPHTAAARLELLAAAIARFEELIEKENGT